ncbi:hypothetical protein Mapa_009096 [Marchantia paleacea]|nr:hypothetical protein Mapa_009096 [Marchantia paleacea]
MAYIQYLLFGLYRSGHEQLTESNPCNFSVNQLPVTSIQAFLRPSLSSPANGLRQKELFLVIFSFRVFFSSSRCISVSGGWRLMTGCVGADMAELSVASKILSSWHKAHGWQNMCV